MMDWASDLGALLGQQIIYAAIVALIVSIIIKLARVKSPLLRQGLWSLVFLRLVLPTDFSSPISIRGASEDMAQAAQARFHQAVSEFEKPKAAAAVNPAVSSVEADVQPFDGRFQRMPLIADQIRVVDNATPAQFAPIASEKDSAFPWIALALAFWAVGVGIFSSQYVRGWVGYVRAVRRGQIVDDAATQNMLGYWRAVMGVRRPVKLVAGANHISPFTMGLFRPVIFVPEALAAPERRSALDAALGHEMAHIRRLDDLWIKFEAIIKITYFFFPVVWWAGARIEAAREEACDALALHRGQRQAKVYATGLLTALKLCAEPHRVAPCPGLTQAMGGLRQRLLNLKAKKESPMATYRSLAIIALVGGCALPLAQASDAPQDSTEVSDAFAQAEAPKAPPQPVQPPRPELAANIEISDGGFADALAEREFSSAMERFNAQMAAIPQAEVHPKHVFGKEEVKHMVTELQREIADLNRDAWREIRGFDRKTRGMAREGRDLRRQIRGMYRELRGMRRKMSDVDIENRAELAGIMNAEERAELKAQLERELAQAEEKLREAEEEIRLKEGPIRLAQDEIQRQVEARMQSREIIMEAHSEAVEVAMRVMEEVQVQIEDIMSDEDLENLEDRVERAVELAHEKARKAMEDAMQSVEESREKTENKK